MEPRILILGKHPETPALMRLEELDGQGVIRLEVLERRMSVKESLAQIIQPDISQFQALICRPTRGANITDLVIKGVTPPFYIATLSVGTDRIKVSSKLASVINATGDSNATSVAELTVALAISLQRSLNSALGDTKMGHFSNVPYQSSQQLKGKTWGFVGAGHQVCHLISQMAFWGLDRLLIFFPRGNAEEKLVEIISSLPFAGLCRPVSALEYEIPQRANKPLTLVGTQKVDELLPVADIISLHLPLVEEVVTPSDFISYHLIDEQRLKLLKPSATIINVARGDIVDEQAVLQALTSGKMGGYATDVLNQNAEDSADPEDSPLWKAWARGTTTDTGTPLNLLLTPHIGGTTEQAFNRVTSQVVSKLLRKLGIPESYYRDLECSP